MSYLIPDININIKKYPYEFYLNENIFKNTILANYPTKYKKYLFKIKSQKIDVIISTDIGTSDNINADILDYDDNIIKISNDDKNSICYIYDQYMNGYLIKIDTSKNNTDQKINCITEKVQSESD